ncbi:MAG TPA: hypothetical protein ENJ19_07455 [Gammaproteobacteria bacterium]|nr:hypothetical protein [Gammaproteobacteria bacterium]
MNDTRSDNTVVSALPHMQHRLAGGHDNVLDIFAARLIWRLRARPGEVRACAGCLAAVPPFVLPARRLHP